MDSRKRAVLFGDYSQPHWHPVDGIDREITTMLADSYALHCTEEYGACTRSDLEAFDLLITYADCWQEKTSAQLVDAVLAYVSGGGGLVCIHNGIIMGDYELAQMVGAKFTHHPPYQRLAFRPTGDHPILAGIGTFAMDEEPYQFALDPFTERTMLLEYEWDRQWWPAGWVHTFGRGRIVYLAPGHDVEAFRNQTFRRLIVNSCHWACKSM